MVYATKLWSLHELKLDIESYIQGTSVYLWEKSRKIEDIEFASVKKTELTIEMMCSSEHNGHIIDSKYIIEGFYLILKSSYRMK